MVSDTVFLQEEWGSCMSGWRDAYQESQSSKDSNIIHKALKKELSGPIGARVKELLCKSCENDPRVHSFNKNVVDYIQAECIKGRRSSSIASDLLKKYPHLDKTIAEEFTFSMKGRFQTAFTRARAEDMGLYWYVWKTCKDTRVRDSHKLMDSVLVNWNDPPSPEYLNGEESIRGCHAGEDGCRCYPQPLLRLNSVQWPCKVHIKGHIVIMKEHEFKRVFNKKSVSRVNHLNKIKKYFPTWWELALIITVLYLVFKIL